MITLHLAGTSNIDIATKLGYTAQQVSNILNSEDARTIIEALNSETLNTMGQVATEIQLYAPEILRKKIDYALHGSDDRVRNQAQTELLHIAGHVPVRQVILTKNDVLDKFKDKTEDELRAFVGGTDRGPDGRLLQ